MPVSSAFGLRGRDQAQGWDQARIGQHSNSSLFFVVEPSRWSTEQHCDNAIATGEAADVTCRAVDRDRSVRVGILGVGILGVGILGVGILGVGILGVGMVHDFLLFTGDPRRVPQ